METETEVLLPMKRIFVLALAFVLLTAFALAEEPEVLTLEEFSIVVPDGATVERYDDVTTLVRGSTRVVVQRIPQELSGDGQAQVHDLLTVYDAQTVNVEDIAVEEGLFGAIGLIENDFGEGIHQVPVLLLTDGALLILSGYNMDGDTEAVYALLNDTLAGAAMDGEPVLPNNEMTDDDA